MEEVTYVKIPAAQYELDRTREHETHKRLMRIIALLAILLALEAAVFAYVWSLYDVETHSIDVDTEKGAQSYVIGRDGDIHGYADPSEIP